ncbi:MAG: peptide chain release factor 2 [Christensenellaceae bacterium]|jgi:peptide chain release factor 2|nr:peptide chain release factor 2 [Christensenellaceae bacterium]
MNQLEKLQSFSVMVDEREKELAQLKIAQEQDWNDVKRNQKIKGLEDFVGTYKGLVNGFKDYDELSKLDGMDEELKKEATRLDAEFEKFYLATLLCEKYDESDCTINITAGAGGTEACDWADIVFRMLTRFVEQCDFSYEVNDILDGDGAGIKSASFAVKGMNSYGILKGEGGVHRLVRISPYDANSRRHTSFCAVEVVPVIEKTTLVIDDKDLRVDVYRSSGAGGQHVNKTESAVRITHLPTGVVAASQNQRSQIQNRATAMQALTSKLEFLHYENEQRKLKNMQPVQMKIEWGSQIRSYVLCPYTMVKDHRTGTETSNVQKIMDGDLKMFSDSYLLWVNAGSPSRK